MKFEHYLYSVVMGFNLLEESRNLLLLIYTTAQKQPNEKRILNASGVFPI